MKRTRIPWLSHPRAEPYLFVGLALFLILHVSYPQKRPVAIHSDGRGYYQYIPALLNSDITFDNLPWSCPLENGNRISAYTCGPAILEFPFVFTAWLGSMALGGSTDLYHAEYGQTPLQYELAIHLAGACYLLMGLWFLRRFLNRFFDRETALWTVGLIVMGSNVLFYTTRAPGMSHVYSFALFCVWLWVFSRWMDRPSPGLTLGMGALMGLIVLIRPTNLVLFLVMICYDLRSWPAFYRHIMTLSGRWRHLVGGAGVALLVIFPQLLYWYHVTGQWVVNSYTQCDPTYTFIYWDRPHILKVWFHVWNGLFIYTPLIYPIFLGLFLTLPRRSHLAPVILVIFLLNSWIFGSWFAWNFGGAFCNRPFVEYMALFALPLAYTVQRGREGNNWTFGLLLGYTLLSIWINLLFTYHYNGLWDGENWLWPQYF